MADERELDEKERRALADAWPAAEPPAGFAARVVAARTAPRRRSMVAPAAGVVALLAIVVGALMFRAGGHGSSGEHTAETRDTLALGRRAVAVAEPGAHLAWSVAADGEAHVSQDRGDVFYRVEPGGAFVVTTPAGEIEVKGTCFRVDVRGDDAGERASMWKERAISAVVGAAVATGVVVTVYEGHVRARGNGAAASDATDVHAGEQVTLAGDGRVVASAAPTPAVVAPPHAATTASASPDAPPPADVTREQLLERDRAQREEIALLQARVAKAEAEAKTASAAPPPRGDRDDDDSPMRHKFAGLTHEDLVDMASRCEIRSDMPDYSSEPMLMDPSRATELGLSEEDRATYNRVLQASNDRFVAAVRALYVEVTGDTQGGDQLDLQAMSTEIMRKSGRDASDEARKLVSSWRAGLTPMPADLSSQPPIVRLLWLMSNSGDDLEHQLADALGPDKARAIRGDGFGARMDMAGCRDGANGGGANGGGPP